MSFKIYIEGGGDKNHHLETSFRRAWSKFFEKAKLGIAKPRIVCGGTRNRTFELFSIEINNPVSGRIPILLVDSENKVTATHSVWEHLQTHDSWEQPEDAGDEHAFLMVQTMETWFLTDRSALQEWFGTGFRENSLKQGPQLEDVPKDTVFEVLKRATANCSTPYKKGKISFELLKRVDPTLIEATCPHAKALLDRLRGP